MDAYCRHTGIHRLIKIKYRVFNVELTVCLLLKISLRILKTYGISSISLIRDRDVSIFRRSRSNDAGSLERVFSIYGDFVTTVIFNNNYLGRHYCQLRSSVMRERT